MKRVFEWSLIFSTGLALATVALWGASRFGEMSTYHLRIPARLGQYDLHILIGRGNVVFCDQFEGGPEGVRPLVVDPRRVLPTDIRRGARVGNLTVPGLDFRYYRLASDGYVIWSLKLSLLIPAALLFGLAIASRRRLVRLRARVRSASAGGGSPSAVPPGGVEEG